MSQLARRKAILVFTAFAVAYFLSALIRAITATISPTLTAELALGAKDLGLLAGGYFLGFAAMQLPLGHWLDRHGPKRVILCLLSIAVVGCIAFSWATGFTGLLAARILCGVGVSACLMAPLTGYRRWFSSAALMRANSWMLMSGSLGMVASTLPVQWLMPLVGWRALFLGLAVLLVLAMLVIYWQVPAWTKTLIPVTPVTPSPNSPQTAQNVGYAEVWAHPYFRKMAPIGFFTYGGLVAMQTLWVVPWMTRVAGYSPIQAATGLFWLNMGMLVSFWLWGLLSPWLLKCGLNAERLITTGLPFSFLVLASIIAAAGSLGPWTALALTLYCIACTFVSLAQPAVGMAFPSHLAGRALSAYNLVIFSGVFTIQWGIGLLIDGFRALGWAEVAAFQAAVSIFLVCCMGSYVHFLLSPGTKKS
jgi:predicted MFS family arabinose efflux permease